ERDEAVDINLRAATNEGSEHKVAFDVEGGFQLREMRVNHRLNLLAATIATTHIVRAAPPALQPSGVHCGAAQTPPTLEKGLNSDAEKSPSERRLQQSPARLLKSGEVRNMLEVQHPARRVKVAQYCR